MQSKLCTYAPENACTGYTLDALGPRWQLPHRKVSLHLPNAIRLCSVSVLKRLTDTVIVDPRASI